MKAFLLLLRERFDRERLKSIVAMHRETWYAVSKIRNDKRYAEYIDRVSDEELAGGAGMDDLVKSAADREYQKQLFQEYGLENK